MTGDSAPPGNGRRELDDMFARGKGVDPASTPSPEAVDAARHPRFLRAIRDVPFAAVDADSLPSAHVIDVMMTTAGQLYFLAPRGICEEVCRFRRSAGSKTTGT